MKSLWDKIIDGECPYEEDQHCPLDCHRGEDYCPEFRRIREVGYRKEDFNKRIKIMHDIILQGVCPMYAGKCPDECYREDELNRKYISKGNERCDEYKYAHGILTEPKPWADVGR